MIKNIFIIIIVTLMLSSCATKGSGQAFYFVNGIEPTKMKIGTAIAYFPPSAGKIDAEDWEIIQRYLEIQFGVEIGYVAIMPVREVCYVNLSRNHEQSLDYYHVFDVKVVVDKEKEKK